MNPDSPVALRQMIYSALSRKLQGDRREYENLVQRIFADGNQALWLQALTQNVSLLSKETPELIEKVLNIDWTCETAVSDAFHTFLLHLVSAQSVWISACMDVLVRHLLPSLKHDELVHLDRERLEVYRRKADAVFSRVHETIRTVLGLAPTAFKTLFDHLRSQFPFSSLDIEAHAVYSSNLLQIAMYAPLLRERVLSLLVDRMVDIDVQIAIDDEDERGAQLAAAAAARKHEAQQRAALAATQGRLGGALGDEDDDMIFEMETDGGPRAVSSAFRLDRTLTPSELAASAAARAEGTNLMADKLDVLMELVLQHLLTVCRQHPEQRPALFDCMLRAFDQYVLNTHRSKYTQFLLFFLCAQDPAHIDQFLGYLHQLLFDPKVAVLTRRTCAGYIASFLSRAAYVSLPLHVCQSAQLLSQFLLAYIDATQSGGAEFADSQGSGAAVGSVSSSWGVGSYEHSVGMASGRRVPSLLEHVNEAESAHAVFYSVCQALFYMLCFRHRALMEMAGGPDFVRALQLPRIVSCSLHPLSAILPSVAKMFVRIFVAAGVLEQSAAAAVRRRPESVSPLSLESFFPFDPYLLRNSHAYITGLYTEWESVAVTLPETDSEGEGDPGDDADGDAEAEGSDGADTDEDEDRMSAASFPAEVEHDLSFHSQSSLRRGRRVF